MPPMVTFPSSTVPAGTVNFSWTDAHSGHSSVGVVQWKLKVGTTQNGWDVWNTGPYPATQLNAPLYMTAGISYWVKVEYQKQAGGPWYSSQNLPFAVV